MDNQKILDALPILGILIALGATFFVGKRSGKEGATDDLNKKIKGIWSKPKTWTTKYTQRPIKPDIPPLPEDSVPTQEQLDELHQRVKDLEDK